MVQTTGESVVVDTVPLTNDLNRTKRPLNQALGALAVDALGWIGDRLSLAMHHKGKGNLQFHLLQQKHASSSSVTAASRNAVQI